MTRERWRQIEELYHSARENGRGALAGVAPDLRREVERLLDQDSEGKILDQPAAEIVEAWSGGAHPGRSILAVIPVVERQTGFRIGRGAVGHPGRFERHDAGATFWLRWKTFVGS